MSSLRAIICCCQRRLGRVGTYGARDLKLWEASLLPHVVDPEKFGRETQQGLHPHQNVCNLRGPRFDTV